MTLNLEKIVNDAKQRMIYSHEMTKEGMALALSGEVAELQELTDAMYLDACAKRIGMAVGRVDNLVKKEGRKSKADNLDFNKLIGYELVDVFWYGGLIVDDRKINLEQCWDEKCHANDVRFGRINPTGNIGK